MISSLPSFAQAAALGVPRGPSYGRLVRGESVTSASGATVTPADVMEPGTPGPTVLVVDCPSTEYLASLGASQGLAAWMDGSEQAARGECWGVGARGLGGHCVCVVRGCVYVW